MVWNALDYPALIIPTGSYVDESLDVKKPPHQFYNDSDQANYELCKFEIFLFFFPSHAMLFILILYNPVSDEPALFKHAPITIQLIGRTLEEEAVIRMGEIVHNALKMRAQGPKL